MLKHRFATALLALPILFYALIFGGGTIVYLFFLVFLVFVDFLLLAFPVFLSHPSLPAFLFTERLAEFPGFALCLIFS